MDSKGRKEWTEYGSDYETVFVREPSGKVRKVAEWRFSSESNVQYTAYNPDGSINHSQKYSQSIENWNKYHKGESAK